MANTTSAKKATRKIARRTEINKSRRSRVRSFVRKVEEAIASGDQTAAAEALRAAQPELMRAATRAFCMPTLPRARFRAWPIASRPCRPDSRFRD